MSPSEQNRDTVTPTTGGPLRRPCDAGFSLIELVLVILIIGILSATAVSAYVSMTMEAENASVESTIGQLKTALSVNTMKRVSTGQPVSPHNPFDDLATRPNNYAGAFPDVDLSNCRPGQWAFQSGHAANGNWPVVAYRTKATLATAFGWGSVQWIVFEVKEVKNAYGETIDLSFKEYPPLHVW